jgi:hypothetical protein
LFLLVREIQCLRKGNPVMTMMVTVMPLMMPIHLGSTLGCLLCHGHKTDQ